MKFKSFNIKNFKGIRGCHIELQNETPGSITTLIGLNESGKTTILEAIANFISEDNNLPAVFDRKASNAEAANFIPRHRKANFSDTIGIVAEISLSETDIAKMCLFFKETEGIAINPATVQSLIDVARSYVFKDSKIEKRVNYWTFSFQYKEKGKKKFRLANGVEGAPTTEFWHRVVKYISERIPRICYFPTFLFQLPDRIYLEEVPDESAQNSYYRQILQDVLDAQGDGLSVSTHVVDRVSRERSQWPDPGSFYFGLREKDERAQIDAVFRKMSAELSKVILGAWGEIFQKQPRNTQIVVDWGINLEKNNTPYAQFFILQGQDKFAISERSLGFRWFFSFLLFTQFRAHRKEGKSVIFLFDEPASNLHSKAQLQLLKGFPKITGTDNHIVYSTHSHYMVEPLWLEKAYIVGNKATEHEADPDTDAFSYKPTEIFAQKYRNFVGQQPERASYFQPVLDRLSYVLSPLVGRADCLIVEGKLDYYALSYFKLRSVTKRDFDILPGTGATNMSTLVSLFLGWGRRFVILLDDDAAGRKAKLKYQDDYLLAPTQIITLQEISDDFAGSKLEQVFSVQFIDALKKRLGIAAGAHLGKKQIALYFQEALASSSAAPLPPELEGTQHRFELIFDVVSKLLRR